MFKRKSKCKLLQHPIHSNVPNGIYNLRDITLRLMRYIHNLFIVYDYESRDSFNFKLYENRRWHGTFGIKLFAVVKDNFIRNFII